MRSIRQRLRRSLIAETSLKDIGRFAILDSKRTAIKQPVQQLAAEEGYFLQSRKHTGESSQ
jgi:hypothetical protein